MRVDGRGVGHRGKGWCVGVGLMRRRSKSMWVG